MDYQISFTNVILQRGDTQLILPRYVWTLASKIRCLWRLPEVSWRKIVRLSIRPGDSQTLMAAKSQDEIDGTYQR